MHLSVTFKFKPSDLPTNVIFSIKKMKFGYTSIRTKNEIV